MPSSSGAHLLEPKANTGVPAKTNKKSAVARQSSSIRHTYIAAHMQSAPRCVALLAAFVHNVDAI